MKGQGGRHRCRCTQCDCSSTAYHAGDPCPSCQAGYHHPPREVQEHVKRGLLEWIRMAPVSLGSSGPTNKQFAQAAEVWTDWHRREGCPLGWQP